MKEFILTSDASSLPPADYFRVIFENPTKKLLYKEKYPDWMKPVNELYGIPIKNLVEAFELDYGIRKTFNGTGRWIKNIGKSYFNTGLVFAGTTFRIKSKFQMLSDSGWVGIFGDYTSETTNTVRCLQYSGQNALYFGLDTIPTSGIRVNVDKKDVHEVEMTNNSLSVDGISYAINKTKGSSNTNTMKLLMANSSSSYEHNNRLAYFYGETGSTKVFYIPFLEGTTPKMIDLYTMTKLEGTGTFAIE